jgi:hypothetical protein
MVGFVVTKLKVFSPELLLQTTSGSDAIGFVASFSRRILVLTPAVSSSKISFKKKTK